MNAYELADQIDNFWNLDEQEMKQAANMLRQQADRIAELEAEISNRTWIRKLLTEEKQSEPINPYKAITNTTIEPTVTSYTAPINEQKPVAWIEPDVIPLTHIIKAVVRREQDEQYSIPLYTTPQTKPLSDEEIEQVWKSMSETKMDFWMIDFAKAIEAKVRGSK